MLCRQRSKADKVRKKGDDSEVDVGGDGADGDK